MRTPSVRWCLVVLLGMTLLAVIAIEFVFTFEGNAPEQFKEAMRHSPSYVIYEGLPHQEFERELLAAELKSKAVREIGGYPFYDEALVLTLEDSKQLTQILVDTSIYFSSKLDRSCGGFHPDFAVEWSVGIEQYRTLICLGCGEAKLSGPGFESHHDVSHFVKKRLSEIMTRNRKNRPSRSFQ